MTQFIDVKYINLLSSYLQRFKQKKENLWNFRCPFCGDSEKNKIKARGYIFYNGEAYLYKCQNCQYTTNLFLLLQYVDQSLYKSYVLENFSHKTIKKPTEIKKLNDVIYHKNKRIDMFLDPVSILPKNHWLIYYLEFRKIPTVAWNNLYFAPDFKLFVSEFNISKSETLKANDPRLIIPFYDENNTLIGFQGRTLIGDKAKYITIMLSDESLKLYGLEKIKKDQLIQVVEGPIDSFFLSNAVATCDSDLSRSAKYLNKENLVLIWDNDYHNKDILKSVIKAIDNKFNLCIFPKTIKQKDINDMVISGMTIEEINILINQNTFSGLRAKLELQNR